MTARVRWWQWAVLSGVACVCALVLATGGRARTFAPPPDGEALVALAQLVETEHRRVDLLVAGGRHEDAIEALDRLAGGAWPAFDQVGEAGMWLRHDTVGRLVRLELDHGQPTRPRIDALLAETGARLEDARTRSSRPDAFSARLAGLRGELFERIDEDDRALQSYATALEMNRFLLDALLEARP